MTASQGDDEYEDVEDVDKGKQRKARREAAVERAEQNPIPTELRTTIANEIEPQTMHTETDHGDVMDCIGIAYLLIRDWIEAEADARADQALGGFSELGKAVRELSGPDAWDEADLEQRLEVITREVPKLLNLARAAGQVFIGVRVPDQSSILDCLTRAPRTTV